MRCAALAVFALVAVPLPAQAEEENFSARQVVQRRQYQLKHELTVSAGFLPLDAYYKGVTANVGYTYHFNSHFAWRVGRGSFVLPISTALSKQIGLFGQKVTDNPEVRAMVGSELMWNAFYGKTSFMNLAVLRGSIFFLLGGDLVLAESVTKSVTESGTEYSTKSLALPAVSLGGGLRAFATEWLSFRLEITNHFVIGTPTFNVVDLQLAAAVNLGS